MTRPAPATSGLPDPSRFAGHIPSGLPTDPVAANVRPEKRPFQAGINWRQTPAKGQVLFACAFGHNSRIVGGRA